jgi:LysR family glycine cleavage system transcriptional activator
MLQRSLLPGIANLLAFEAAARHGSVSRAAEELNLTQSAISRQILQLEASLGIVLFKRVRKRIVLTDAARIYVAELRPALEDLSKATHNAMALVGIDGILNLAVMPTFASRWLIPRLPAFLAHHPNATVNFTSRIEPFDFAHESFDAAIHFGSVKWPGTVGEHLMDEEVVPVCSPSYLAQNHISCPRDLAKAKLLQQTTRPTLWADWFSHTGTVAPGALRGHRFEQYAMIEQAAFAGMGVALLPRFVVEDDIATGQLQLALPNSVLTTEAYSIVYPEPKGDIPLVQAFRDWIVREARTASGNRSGVGQVIPLRAKGLK